jgi:hypothetical protein
MKKTNVPDVAPQFNEGHVITGIVTVISGLISALALGFHIYRDAVIDVELVKWGFVILAGLFAFGMALTPMSLARAHGESIEGASAQNAILGIVLLVMIVDGALQVHAAHFLMATFGYTEVPVWQIGIIAAAFQIAMFFVRGALYQARKEIQELIDAKNERLAVIEARERAEANAKRREREAEKKGGLRIVQN